MPTVAQVQRALDTLHNNTRSGHGNLYSQECGRSRVSDPINFPLGRSSAKEFGKIIQAAAFVEMASDRVRFKKAVAAGWAEARCPSQPKFQQSVELSICLDTRTDVSGSVREVKIKIVNEKYEVSRRLLALTDIKGCKTSLGKVGQIKETLNDVSKRTPTELRSQGSSFLLCGRRESRAPHGRLR